MEVLASRSVLSRSSSSGVHLFIWFVDTKLLPLRLEPTLAAGLFVGVRGANRQDIDSLCRELSCTGHALTEPFDRLRFRGVGLQPDLDQPADGLCTRGP